MEAENHVQHGRSSKSHTCGGDFLRLACFALLAAFMFVGCGDDPDDKNNVGLFGIEKGRITYQVTGWFDGKLADEGETMTITFDKYGKLFRQSFGDTNNAIVQDVDAGIMYTWSYEPKMYIERPLSNAGALIDGYLYFKLKDTYQRVPQLSLKAEPNRTIAGKNCEVFSVDDGAMEYAGWNGIVFFFYGESLDDDGNVFVTILEAISFSDVIPANSFTPPADYEPFEF